MFDKKTYINRREQLKKLVSNGVILILGNVDVPMNYRSNIYHFRQDSSFLYFFGLDNTGLAGIIDVDEQKDIIFGNDATLGDVIWMGPQPSIREQAAEAGVEHTAPFNDLAGFIKKVIDSGRPLHFLPPYRAENKILLETLTGIKPDEQTSKASVELIKAVVSLRSVKEPQEIQEMERAMETAWLMHTTAMRMAKPGVYEREIAGVVEGIALSSGGMLSFPIILTVHGETLHNHYHGHKLKAGDLLLTDTGTESPMHYATDHTRTVPVGGKFTGQQKDIYEIVLDAQIQAIKAMKPGIPFREVHVLAASVIGKGLKDLGLMKGDIETAVQLGAHAMFMPHGLGHMMGLDVHDMEDLGENYVGYDDEFKRSDIFGNAFLRFGRRLEKGFVMTVEPGIYFIPALVEKWEAEGKFKEYINYDKVKAYLGFGGIRIEDDVHVTADGHEVMGKPIPKTVADIEQIMG